MKINERFIKKFILKKFAGPVQKIIFLTRLATKFLTANSFLFGDLQCIELLILLTFSPINGLVFFTTFLWVLISI